MNKKLLVYPGIGVGVIVIVMMILVTGVIISDVKDSTFKIESDSMTPILKIGEFVEADRSYSFENIREGDIIVFHPVDLPETIIVHRVVSIINEDPRILMTKGDSNLESIPDIDYPITEKQYLGKVVSIFPNVDSIFSKENMRYP
ncbi:MAG: signal peptidase I [Nitrosopumilus sp.]|nr:signal peptidase I [Nitrosopumilus sp.]MDH3736364.1 signal peptidase I [Nitrosopumilus sp.]MDH3822319.1 signal peptidase I [Nitrosopumilus sp.]MDH3834408.1 signal peptidase I [Nitrosopumilus sp.]